MELTCTTDGPRFCPMRTSSSSTFGLFKFVTTASFVTALALSPLAFAHEHEEKAASTSTTAAAAADTGAGEKTVKGEIVDLMCYLDHAATGDKHAACASKCVKNGGPVG